MHRPTFFQDSNKKQLLRLKNTMQNLKNNQTMSATDKIVNFKKISIRNAAILKNPHANKEIIIAAYIQLAELYANISFLYSQKNSMTLAVKGYSEAIKCIDYAETIFTPGNQQGKPLDKIFIEKCNTYSLFNPTDAKKRIQAELSPDLLERCQPERLFTMTRN